MNLKLLKYNIGLMMSLYALLWGLEKNPEVSDAIKQKIRPALSEVEQMSPTAYRTIASVAETVYSSVIAEDKPGKPTSEKVKLSKDKDKSKDKKSVKNKETKEIISKKELKKIYSSSIETPAPSIPMKTQKQDNKIVFSGGAGFVGNNSPVTNTSKPTSNNSNPNVAGTKQQNADISTPAPMELACPETQEKINGICVDLPQIQSVSDQSLKTISEIRVPLVLSDERYNCDALSFAYDPEYIAGSDLTIVKEGTDCFLKIKPSLNKSGNTIIGIKLVHNAKEIASTFNLELISLTSVVMESFPSVIPKDLEFTPKVKGTFSDSTEQEISLEMTWQSDDQDVIENLNNVVLQAKNIGESEITATIKEFSVNKTVESQTWSGMFLSDYYVKGFLNSEIQLKAFVFLSSGTVFDLTPYINWLSYQEEIAYVAKGKSTMQGVGVAKVDVFFSDQQKTTYIDVNNKQLSTVDIVGPSILTPWGQSRYSVIASFDDNTTQDISSIVDLTVVDPGIASMSDNLILPLSLGNTKIQLSIGELTFEKDISVELNTLNSIVIRPSNYLAYKNQTIDYSIYGVYSDGQEFDITNQATLTMSANTIATLSDKKLSVTNASNAFGEATISTNIGGVIGSTKIYFNPATVLSSYIHSDGELSVGSTSQLRVLANLNDGGIADLTQLAKFSSTSDNIVGIGNSYYNRGKIYGMELGSSDIVAEIEGSTVTKKIVVNSENTMKDLGFGLTAEYYNGTRFNTYKGKRLDKNINFNWLNNVKAPMGVTDAYSVRWTGKFKAPSTMTYYFCTDSDDGVKVWLNNNVIIDNFTDHAERRDCSGAIPLIKDQKVNFKLEFFENGGFAVIKAYYGPNTGSQTIIPMENFFPE